MSERAKEAVDFLSNIWMYTHLDAKCFAIVAISDKRTFYRHWCIEEEKGDNYPKIIQRIGKYLEKLLPDAAARGEHVYFQVLPLAAKPEKGRGSARDVKVGQWLWCDLDYKTPVDAPQFQGCEEGQDHALECYYEEGGKWVHVKRPPLSEVLQQVRDKLGFDPTLVVDSGAGYHLYFKLLYPLPASKVALLEAKLVDALGGDPKSKDLARILRLPGSVNPRVNRDARVIYRSDVAIEPDLIEKRLRELGEKAREQGGAPFQDQQPAETPQTPPANLNELPEAAVLKIVELLKDAYKPGFRQHLVLYLSGWLAKAGVSPVTAARIAKMLYEATGDADPLKTRLSAVVYSYRKTGVDVDRFADAIEQVAGVKPYGLGAEIQEDTVKGKTGLQEILEQTLGEERALAVLQELQELLNTLSPYRDSVIEVLNYSAGVFAVADLRKLMLVRAKKEENRLKYMEKVCAAAPTRVVVYVNPLGGTTKYEVTFEGATLRKPLVMPPSLLEEIADRLRLEGLVYHRRLLEDILSAIIQAYIRRGKAEVKTEIESPGFYLIDGKLVAVKYEVRPPDAERLRQALELLNEIVDKWFSRARDRVATVLKWGAIAPFGYVIKQRGRWLKWLYLYGDSDTGKTTLGRIVLRMWEQGSQWEKSGASIDTEARLGYVLSSTTFPILVNEPGGALSKDNIIEMVKNSVDGKIARSKYARATYVDYPALAPLVLTSNRFIPRDDALLKRLLVVSFSYGDKVPPDKQREFRANVEPRFSLLGEVGKCISHLVLDGAVDVSVLDQDPLEAGKTLLAKCYEIAGLPVPSWLEERFETHETAEEHVIEEFAERLKKLVHDTFARHVSRVIEIDVTPASSSVKQASEYTLEQRLKILLEKDMIPGIRLVNGEVYITHQLLRELGLETRVSVKSLAEMLGWDYRAARLGKTVVKAMVATLDQLVELVAGK